MVKSVKAEGQPKRPMSAYFLWMNAEGREGVKQENPGASITEISKKCGEAWKNIDEKKKRERMIRRSNYMAAPLLWTSLWRCLRTLLLSD